MPARRGFSLVELMIVLGIITTLMALLAPALVKARDQASRIKCQSNLSQIVAACTSYACDNEGACPWSNWLGPELAGYRPQGWLYRCPPGAPWQSATFDVQTGSLFSRLGTPAVYHCPQDSEPYEAGPIQALSSYLINGATCGYGRHLPAYRLTAFPSNSIMFWEPDPFSQPWSAGAMYPSHEITARHGGGGSIGCYDGHVEWMFAPDFANEEVNLPGRLWCNPGTQTGT